MTQASFLPASAAHRLPDHTETLRQFNELRPWGGFNIIMVDPPWRFDTWSSKGHDKSPQAQYECHGPDWIKALPIEALAADHAILWLWATGPLLPLALECVTAWGFTFKTMGWWSKKTSTGKQAFGTGYILRNAGEPFLIGTKGSPKTVRNIRATIEAPVRRHSQKPDLAFDEAGRMLSHDIPRRIEVFSRTSRPGWAHWGDQVDSIPIEVTP